ncbi:hypothetical protein AAHE18_16G016100 [Arachis hypogaea]
MQHALKYYFLIFYAVYTPKMTRFFTEAEEPGATVVTGLEMFLGQAYGQFEKYTGMPAPKQLFKKNDGELLIRSPSSNCYLTDPMGKKFKLCF